MNFAIILYFYFFNLVICEIFTTPCKGGVSIQKDNYIRLPNDIYDDLSINNKEFTILMLLYRYYVANRSIGIYSIQMLVDLLRVNTKNNPKIVGEIKDTILSLIEKKYIVDIWNLDGENNIDNKNSFFYLELIPPPKEFYFMIHDDDIDEILKYCQTKNLSKYDLIRYFVACRRMSNNEAQFGYLTQLKLKQLINDSRTIQRYNNILQDDLHLIRYDNNYLTPEKHYCRTFIGEYDDKLFDKKVKDMASFEGLVLTNKIKANKKRSVKQKINNTDTDDKARIKELEEELHKLQYKDHSSDDEEIIDLLNDLNIDCIPESLRITKQLEEEKDDDKDVWGETDFFDNWGEPEEDSNNDYDTETLFNFLPFDALDLYADEIADIAKHLMTVKDFFEDIYDFAEYSDFLEFRNMKEKESEEDSEYEYPFSDKGPPTPLHKTCICCNKNFFTSEEDERKCPECIEFYKRHNQKAQETKYAYNELDW